MCNFPTDSAACLCQDSRLHQRKSVTNNTLSTLTPQNTAPGLQSCQAPWRQSGGARHKAQEAALVSRVQPCQHRQEVAHRWTAAGVPAPWLDVSEDAYMLVDKQLEWLRAEAQLGWPAQLAGVRLSWGLGVKQPIEPGRAER